MYKATIDYTSKELTARDKLFVKDTADAIRIDTLTAGGTVVLTPDYYAILHVECDKSEKGEYTQLVLVDTAGTKYVTGSDSFIRSLEEIFDAMAEETEPYDIKVYGVESKNYKGKSFLKCSIV